MADLKRVYKLLCCKHASDDLKKCRLKVSTFADVNDPFELDAFGVAWKGGLRREYDAWRESLQAEFGLLCFSENWHEPVLWSHYGDKHAGVCLGFDVPSKLLQKANYVEGRLRIEEAEMRGCRSSQRLKNLLFSTKSDHWKYEQEYRMIVKLRDMKAEDSMFFHPFNERLQLKQVFVGPRCGLTLDDVKETVAAKTNDVAVAKVRLARWSYCVVK